MATQTIDTTPADLSISHLLVEETGRISGDIYRRTIDTSPWLKLVKQGAWPNEMGDTLSVLTYERTLAASQSWSNINSDSTTFCIPTATEIDNAQTTRTYGLAHTAIESAPICVHGVRMGYRFREQLKAVYDNLVENVSWAWKNRYRDQYESWAGNHIIAGSTTAGGSTLLSGSGTNMGGTGMPTQDGGTDLVTASISRLTQGLLDRVYMQLVRDGAGINPMGRENGRPVFTIITSAESSDKIIRESEIRDDFRYSPQVSELLKPLGVERSYRGFYHLIDPFPKRYTYNSAYTGTGTGGDMAQWVEVAPYIVDSSWTGKVGSNSRYIVNPDYETADYEDTIVFHTDVMESLIPTPIANAGSGVKFNPLTYRGKFDFLNIKDRVENPDGSWGYFRGVLANAAKPVKPQWGYVIRHKRCDPLTKLDCAGASITGGL
jgi:hypothetical protein